MSFALPFALILSALALPIIALYILKVRLRRVPVSTNLFWKQIYDEKPPRSIWQHLRHLLSLLAQLLILLLLVVSVADPYFSSQLLTARRIVIVIDRSASMRSRDIGPSRFGAAISAAHDMVEGLRFRDEFAVVLADSRPEVVLGMTGHAPTLHRVIDEIRVTDGSSDLVSATALGRQLIGQHPHGQVVVLTDGCSAMSDASVPTVPIESSDSALPSATGSATVTPTIAYRIFGSAAGNVGITQFQVRRSLVDPIGYEILTALTNASDQPVTLRLELTLDEMPVDVIPLTLKPEERWSRSLEKTSLAGGIIRAALTRIQPGGSANDSSPNAVQDSAALARDARAVNHLSTDDEAWAILPGREVQHVLIVSPGNLFLQKVFEANPLVEVEMVKELPEVFPGNSLVVLHQAVPMTLPEGNVLVIDPASGCDLWDVGDVIANPIVTEQDQTSPLMTHIRLDNVLVPEARQLKFASPPAILAGTLSGDAVYAAVKRTNGKCLVLSVNLERSDLAFRTAFPIMMANSLGWFSGRTGELRPALATGGMASVPVPRETEESSAADNPDTVSLNVTSPSGLVNSIRGTGEFASIGPLAEVGIWTVEPSPTPSAAAARDSANPAPAPQSPGHTLNDGLIVQQIAVNLASEKESDVRTPAAELSRPTDPTLAGLWFSRPIWFYMIVAAVMLVAVEWLLYQRRLIT